MRSLSQKLLLLLAVMITAAPTAFSQNNGNSTPPSLSSEQAAEEKLPFLQQDAPATDSTSTGSILMRTFGAMLLVVGLIFFGAWGLKKMGFAGKGTGSDGNAPELSIISSVTVGNGRTISTVKFGNRMLLVGSTPQSFTLLADGPENDDEYLFTANSAASPRSVADLLAEENSFEQELAKADSGLLSLFNGGRS